MRNRSGRRSVHHRQSGGANRRSRRGQHQHRIRAALARTPGAASEDIAGEDASRVHGDRARRCGHWHARGAGSRNDAEGSTSADQPVTEDRVATLPPAADANTAVAVERYRECLPLGAGSAGDDGAPGVELSPRVGSGSLPPGSIRPVCAPGRRLGGRHGTVGAELPPTSDQRAFGPECCRLIPNTTSVGDLKIRPQRRPTRIDSCTSPTRPGRPGRA